MLKTLFTKIYQNTKSLLGDQLQDTKKLQNADYKSVQLLISSPPRIFLRNYFLTTGTWNYFEFQEAY